MAYWTRRKDTNQIRVWDKYGKSVPRSKYKHLDGQPDYNIRQWVDNYERQYEGKKWTPDRIPDGSLKRLLEQYITFMRDVKGRDHKTCTQHACNLRDYAFPYFLGQDPPMQQPNDWPYVSGKMCEHFLGVGLSGNAINRVNTALRAFWAWGRAYQHITTTMPLELVPAVVEARPTPLKVIRTPDDMLTASALLPDRMRLVVMLGYFFSLRPQEIFGVRYADFDSGSAVLGLEASKAMREMGLYDRLVVNVLRQRDTKETVKKLKTPESQGWVACFDERAARVTVKLLNTLKDDIFPRTYFQYEDEWADSGLPKMTFKDLRRASLYWLGHHTGFTSNHGQLMKHARHKKLETTLRYCRRPEETVERKNELLDLDA